MSLGHTPDGATQLTVRLDPPELGHVEVRIDRLSDAGARVEITVEKAETLTLLLRDQQQLQHALDQAGVPADGRSVTFHIASPEPTSRNEWASPSAPGAAAGGLSGDSSHGASRQGGQPGRQHAGMNAGDETEVTPIATPDWARAVSTSQLDAKGNHPMSLASVAAQQNSTSTAAAQQTGSAALNSLSANFGDFLKLLMTQLQNQDPTSPLDTNQFTSELVQFSSVEQQINTNTSLTQLIQLTQAGEVMQASNITGKTVTVSSDHVPLQNGKGTVKFTAPAAEQVAIAIYSDTGAKLSDATMTATKGTNTWTWDGTDSSGRTLPDGSYKVAVAGANADGTVSALPFSVVGTATGVLSQANAVQLQLGTLSVDFSKVQSVGN